MSKWTEIARLEDIPRLGARVLRTDTMDIALFRTAADEVFALRDECPHKQGPLSQGIVHGTSVTCPLHNWKIDLASGKALGPDEGCTNVSPSRSRTAGCTSRCAPRKPRPEPVRVRHAMLFGRHRKNPIRIADKGVTEWRYATCGYCSTGCSIEVGLDADGEPVASRGVADADVNRGKLCIKGIFEHELFRKTAGRGDKPLMRTHRWDAFRKRPGTSRWTKPPRKSSAFRRATGAMPSPSSPPARS